MLKYNDLRNFLAENNDPAKFNLLCILDSLSVYLEAHITLIDNSGSILYRKKESKNVPKQQEQILLSIKQPHDAMLTIEKSKITQLDKVLIEIASGLISLHMH